MIQFRKLLFSWIVAAMVMFSLSYLWHGIILNDYDRLDYPKSIYLGASIVAYLVIGLVVSKAYEIKILDKFEKKPVIRGIIGGVASGFIIYLIAFVVGISFGGRKIEYVIVDLFWQMFEQSIGGLAVGITHIAMHVMGWIKVED